MPSESQEELEKKVLALSQLLSELQSSESALRERNQQYEKYITELNSTNSEWETITKELKVARDQALESSKLKSQFVANISHEIRTPISGVIGITELLLNTSLDTNQRHLAVIAHESAISLLTIINDILDFSKIEAGKIVVVQNKFSLADLIESSVQLLTPSASQKNLTILTSIDPTIPNTVTSDAIRIRQILWNLLSNAIKFTEKGSIHIRTDLLSTGNDSCVVRIAVADTGIGVDKDQLNLLFHPFVQIDGSSTKQYSGTGLGLSICKCLVELMDGEIGVESNSESGSTFWFALPLTIEEPETAEPDTRVPDTRVPDKAILALAEEISFEHLIDSLGLDSTTEILQSFVPETNTLLADLERTMAAKDAKESGITGHQLKGVVSILEIKQLDTSCIELQIAAKSSDWQTCSVKFQEVTSQMNAVHQAIQRLVGDG